MRSVTILFLATLIAGCNAAGPSSPEIGSATSPSEATEVGQLIDHPNFPSAFVQSRRITIWLPPKYNVDTAATYPVIYAHDGQNLFYPAQSYSGAEWELDETAARLMTAGDIRPAVIVGIWNTDERWQEYAPQKAFEHISLDEVSEQLEAELPELKADSYLRFIIEELKPFIDTTYRTKTDADNTLIMGSSMGGLISLYAAAEYPNSFSKVAAVSIHWPIAEPDGLVAAQADRAMQTYLASSGIDPARHTIWFDRGDRTLDASYAPHAEAMEAWFRDNGWSEDQATFREYPGTDHSENAWAERTDDILIFLLSE